MGVRGGRSETRSGGRVTRTFKKCFSTQAAADEHAADLRSRSLAPRIEKVNRWWCVIWDEQGRTRAEGLRRIGRPHAGRKHPRW